uniref:Uncharacterized protein n=1 Tax=Globodera rostochiensis TaxID=31243 RepID=A0A914HPJ3_GLORO
MEYFWIVFFVLFFATNSLDKAESVQLEELPLQTFDELFVDEWWDKDEAAEDLKMPPPTNFGQNVHHQIDRQNTQIGQIEPNSTDQNPPLTEILLSQSLITLDKLNPIQLIRILLTQNETVAKELGLSFKTIYNWKRKLGQTEPKPKYANSKQMELMKLYYEIKDQTPKISDENIAKRLSISRFTLYKWKKQFKPNSVDGHSVEENAAANVQEIGDSNSGTI